MQEIQALAATCRVATAHDVVLNTECCYTFHTPYTSDAGIVVNLQTFMGTVEELALRDGADKQLFVRIVKKRVAKEPKDGEEAPAAPTKLAIGVEGGFAAEEDKYETFATNSIVVLQKGSPPSVVVEVPYADDTKADFPTMVASAADAILCHVGMTTQQEVKVWQADETIPVSKYAADLPFVDNGVMIDPSPSSWKCQKSGATENLWLNLSDGFIGGGRKNWDGSGGSNGALEHYEETGKEYPLVVKLGTITSDLDTADCYSYAGDEDGPVKVPNLAELLQKRGIKVSSLQKTVKSTAELEVELNANYAFDAITEAGSELEPLSGAGLQGLQNLGNSCYMNATLQLLLSGTIPELAKRYGTHAGGSVTSHPFLNVSTANAPLDLLCQTTKMANALTSGVFAQPVAEKTEGSTDPKYRLAPRMFKHVIGKDHVDFCTGQQQDAAQFLQYLLERLDRAELGAAAQYPGRLKIGGEPMTASHTFNFKMEERLACAADGKIKYKTSAPETIWSLRIPMDKAVVVEQKDDGSVASPEQKRLKPDEEKKPVPTIAFTTCVEEWAKETSMDGMRWPHLQNAVHPAAQRTRFANYPRYLIVQMQRYELGPDWQPIKLEVNLDIAEEIDLSAYKSSGPHECEELVPEVSDAMDVEPAGVNIDEGALGQLMDMGFSMNSCKRALNAVGGSDVEAAMNWVFEHSTDPDFNDPLPEPSASGASESDAGMDEGIVETLVASLGCFTSDQVRAALKETNGAADRAADWLFSHMDDLDGAIAALQSKDQAATSSTAATSTTLEDGEGKYTMVGMVSHIGKNTGSGHYVAHLKKEGRWVIFNDEKVAVSSQPPFAHAYLYLFQRKDTIGSPHPNY